MSVLLPSRKLGVFHEILNLWLRYVIDAVSALSPALQGIESKVRLQWR
jgi:hypothetical protein